MRALLTLFVCCLFALSTTVDVQAIDNRDLFEEAPSPFGERPNGERIDPLYEGNFFARFPTCDATKVKSRIISRFKKAENRTWKRGFLISDISNTRSVRDRTNGNPEIHSRRFCKATALFSNGRKATVHYLIEEGGGIAGIGYNLVYCIAHLDPWRNQNRNCSTVRPPF